MLLRTKNSILFMLLIGLVIASAQLAAQERATAVADGYGETIDKAVQNSAKNALIQLAGTFIDVETSIESRREIRGAIEETYKSFSERSSEYSQGSVESLEVLSTEQDGATYIVTSKVTVRLETFKNYIRSTALAEAGISENLFARVQQKKTQNQNLADIVVGRLISDVFNIEVVKLEVGAADAISDPSLEAELRRKLNATSEEVLISVPVSAYLDPNFYSNARTTLQKTASIGRSGRGIASYCEQVGPAFAVIFAELSLDWSGVPGVRPQNVFGRGCWISNFLKFKLRRPDETHLYGFQADKAVQLCAAAETFRAENGFRGFSKYTIVQHPPAVSLRVTDQNKRGLVETMAVKDDLGFVRSDRAIVLGELQKPGTARQALTFLAYSADRGKCRFVVNTASSFTVVVKLHENELARARSIEVSLQRL